jgi:hypothetical protein
LRHTAEPTRPHPPITRTDFPLISMCIPFEDDDILEMTMYAEKVE